MDRRTFTKAMGLAVSAGVVTEAWSQEPRDPGAVKTATDTLSMPVAGNEPFRVGMVIFDDMTNMDFAPVADIFARVRAAKVHVLAKSKNAVVTDSNLSLVPEMTLSEAPDLDMLFIGGGPGSTALMEDGEVLEFFSKRAPRAKWITSVCTGALVLGAAGLLRGYKAATHWTAMEILPLLGAEPVHKRVVIDRNRITGGGVTAGIDFGLTVVAELFGQDMAEMIQLGQEYNPQPPFSAGSPETASPALVAHFRGMWTQQTEDRVAAAKRAALKFI